jgi:hypothetical protein
MIFLNATEFPSSFVRGVGKILNLDVMGEEYRDVFYIRGDERGRRLQCCDPKDSLESIMRKVTIT